MSDLGVNRRDSVITPTPPNSPQGVIRRTPQHTPALAGVPLGEHQARKQPTLGPEALEDDSVFSAPTSRDSQRNKQEEGLDYSLFSSSSTTTPLVGEETITSIHFSYTSVDSTMATKEELVNNFKDEKVTAEIYLELITIKDTMTADDFTLAIKQLRLATASYVNMSILYKIKLLHDSTITKDELDDLKGDLDDLKAILMAVPRLLSMMELNAADERCSSFDTPTLGDVNSYQKEFSALTYIRNTPEMTRVKELLDKFNSSKYSSPRLPMFDKMTRETRCSNTNVQQVKVSLITEEVSAVPKLSSVETPRTEGEWDICYL